MLKLEKIGKIDDEFTLYQVRGYQRVQIYTFNETYRQHVAVRIGNGEWMRFEGSLKKFKSEWGQDWINENISEVKGC